jgi:hypothetical protein
MAKFGNFEFGVPSAHFWNEFNIFLKFSACIENQNERSCAGMGKAVCLAKQKIDNFNKNFILFPILDPSAQFFYRLWFLKSFRVDFFCHKKMYWYIYKSQS